MSSTGPSLWLEVKNVWKVVSSISKKVTHDIQSSMLSIIDDNLKENLPSLLSEALKNTFPHMIIDSIKQSVSNTIEEKLPVFYAQVKQTLQDQLPSILKPMNKLMFKDMVLLLEAAEVFKKANAERENASKHQLKNKSPVNEENALILYTLVKKGSEENTSEKKVSDDEPLIKKLKAQAQKMAEYEGKRKKMLDEYNHQISHRVDQLPITKISYRVNSSKEASMRIIRGNDPLNLTVYEKFRLKTRRHPTRVFVKENIVVDGMQRNLIPPPGIEESRGRVIRENLNQKSSTTMGAIQRGTLEAEEMFKKMEMTIEAGNDVDQARKIIRDNLDGLGQDMYQQVVTGLAECKASVSNLRHIQVKDIVKEVEDHLKTYSSAGMDISSYVEGIRCGSKESQR
ncbi:hypothetical protein Tco_0866953 [Tanacetum coccineum]